MVSMLITNPKICCSSQYYDTCNLDNSIEVSIVTHTYIFSRSTEISVIKDVQFMALRTCVESESRSDWLSAAHYRYPMKTLYVKSVYK
jgi:hypothetical protein